MSKCTRSTNPVVPKSQVRHPDACVRNPKTKKYPGGQPTHSYNRDHLPLDRESARCRYIHLNHPSSQPENAKDASHVYCMNHTPASLPCHAMPCPNIRTNSYASITSPVLSRKRYERDQDIPLTKSTNLLSLKLQLLPTIHAPTSLLTRRHPATAEDSYIDSHRTSLIYCIPRPQLRLHARNAYTTAYGELFELEGWRPMERREESLTAEPQKES